MKRVLVCSAFAGCGSNVHLAMEACQYAVKQGVAPFAPHLHYPRFLNELEASQRALGIECGLAWLSGCDEVWVFVRNGKISAGMRQECELALATNVPIRWFTIVSGGDAPVEITPMPHLPQDSIPQSIDLTPLSEYGLKVRTSFQDMSKRLQDGARYEDIESELDGIAGGLKARDSEAEAVYEQARAEWGFENNS